MMPDFHISSFLLATPIGRITLIYQDDPFCLNQLLFPSESESRIRHTRRTVRPSSNHPIRQISSILMDYFDGHPIQPPWDFMSLVSFTRLQQAVLQKTAAIPFGSLKSYREIAEDIDRPKAYRFVGTTLAKNPYPIFIPCHRVIRSDHQIGEFGGGVKLKKKLIDFESSQLNNG